jgi:hypothetical protein
MNLLTPIEHPFHRDYHALNAYHTLWQTVTSHFALSTLSVTMDNGSLRGLAGHPLIS